VCDGSCNTTTSAAYFCIAGGSIPRVSVVSCTGELYWWTVLLDAVIHSYPPAYTTTHIYMCMPMHYRFTESWIQRYVGGAAGCWRCWFLLVSSTWSGGKRPVTFDAYSPRCEWFGDLLDSLSAMACFGGGLERVKHCRGRVCETSLLLYRSGVVQKHVKDTVRFASWEVGCG
jgi:hypothetical protein